MNSRKLRRQFLLLRKALGEIYLFLISALVNICSIYPFSDAIREAARIGNVENLKELLNKWKGDPVINQGDGIGTTPLHTAVSNGNRECVEMLLAFGADKELKNCYGQTPYSKAKSNELKQLVKPLRADPDPFCSIM